MNAIVLVCNRALEKYFYFFPFVTVDGIFVSFCFGVYSTWKAWESLLSVAGTIVVKLCPSQNRAAELALLRESLTPRALHQKQILLDRVSNQLETD